LKSVMEQRQAPQGGYSAAQYYAPL
jgi:hypothetical protein